MTIKETQQRIIDRALNFKVKDIKGLIKEDELIVLNQYMDDLQHIDPLYFWVSIISTSTKDGELFQSILPATDNWEKKDEFKARMDVYTKYWDELDNE